MAKTMKTGKDTQSAVGKRSKAKEQPEALATFAAAARSEDKIAPNGGLQSTNDTKSIADNLAAKHDVATKILRENVTGIDEGGTDAARALPDRTRDSN